MDGTVIFGLGLLALGLLFGWLAIRLWKYRAGGSITTLEAGILKATRADPLPRTRFDKGLHYVQMIMAALFGVLLIVVSIYGLFEEAGFI